MMRCTTMQLCLCSLVTSLLLPHATVALSTASGILKRPSRPRRRRSNHYGHVSPLPSSSHSLEIATPLRNRNGALLARREGGLDAEDFAVNIESALEAAEIALQKAEMADKKRPQMSSSSEDANEKKSNSILRSDYMLEAIEEEIDTTMQAVQVLLGTPGDGGLYDVDFLFSDASQIVDFLSQPGMSAAKLDAFLGEKQMEANLLKQRIREVKRRRRKQAKVDTAIFVALDGFALGGILGVAAWFHYPDVIGDKIPVVVSAILMGGVLGVTSVMVATSGEWYGLLVQGVLGGGSSFISRVLGRAGAGVQNAVSLISLALLDVPSRAFNTTAVEVTAAFDNVVSVALQKTDEFEKETKGTVLELVKPVVKRKVRLYDAVNERRLAQKAMRELKDQAKREMMADDWEVSEVVTFGVARVPPPDKQNVANSEPSRQESAIIWKPAQETEQTTSLSLEERASQLLNGASGTDADVQIEDGIDGAMSRQVNGAINGSTDGDSKNSGSIAMTRSDPPVEKSAKRGHSRQPSKYGEPGGASSRKKSPQLGKIPQRFQATRDDALIRSTKKSAGEAKSPTTTVEEITKRADTPSKAPTLREWKVNKDRTLQGVVEGSRIYENGTDVSTSPLAAGEDAEEGSVVTTTTGSKYFLGRKTPPAGLTWLFNLFD